MADNGDLFGSEPERPDAASPRPEARPPAAAPKAAPAPAAPARNGTMAFCVPLPAAGTYGIAVRHDVNDNGKTDIRSDGGAMSNNPSINIFNLGKPSYKRTAFSVGDAPRTITINMKYM